MPLIRHWATTYDLFVRLLLPDVALLADGVRSTNDAFRDEIEAILDRIIPIYIPGERLLIVNASDVTVPSRSTGGQSPSDWPSWWASRRGR